MDVTTLPETSPHSLSREALGQFEREGYLILERLGDAALCDRMLAVTLDHLERLIAPLEFEADLQYPGAPPSLQSEGGKTVRRLKQAHARDAVFTEWLVRSELTTPLAQLLGGDLVCPLAHHNCIMTKEPRHSSDTGWHQDTRYWSFERPELINAWLALGDEHPQNGSLKVIPGTHRMQFARERFDDEIFLRTDLPENQELTARSVRVTLNRGDVLLFHARLFHAASRNFTDETKYSVVFTFRSGDNRPIPGTRSASLPELLLHPSGRSPMA